MFISTETKVRNNAYSSLFFLSFFFLGLFGIDSLFLLFIFNYGYAINRREQRLSIKFEVIPVLWTNEMISACSPVFAFIGLITNSDFPLSVMQAQSQTVRWFSLLRVFNCTCLKLRMIFLIWLWVYISMYYWNEKRKRENSLDIYEYMHIRNISNKCINKSYSLWFQLSMKT